MPKSYTLPMKLKHLALRSVMACMSLKAIDKHKVVMVNYRGKGYGDNGKAIAESLIKMDPSLDIVWAAEPKYFSTVPEGIRTVAYNSMSYLYELATAGAWVDNCRKNAGIRKRKGQFYVQTWHGTTAMKQIEQDVADHLDAFYVAGAKNDSRMADVILSGCAFFTKLVRRAFWYHGEVMESGSPRSDILMNADLEMCSRVRKKLGVRDDQKIILYAPTFRADERMDCYQMDFAGVLETLQKKTGQEWVFALRLHPNVADKADFITYSDRLINATGDVDLYELLPAVDFVISDYSSVMFDAGLIGKPVILFATDVEDYIADRSFYFDIFNMPFKLVQSNEELLCALENFEQTTYDQALMEFNQTVGYCERGTAADTVAARILEELNG